MLATHQMRLLHVFFVYPVTRNGYLLLTTRFETLYQPDGTTLKFSLSRIGGTSMASPTFAGVGADAQQAAGHPLPASHSRPVREECPRYRWRLCEEIFFDEDFVYLYDELLTSEKISSRSWASSRPL
jgi:hypothetical protein